MKWSVSIQAEGDRVLELEEIVALADAVAGADDSWTRRAVLSSIASSPLTFFAEVCDRIVGSRRSHEPGLGALVDETANLIGSRRPPRSMT